MDELVGAFHFRKLQYMLSVEVDENETDYEEIHLIHGWVGF